MVTPTPLRPHHQATLNNAIAHFQQDPAALAILLGGSIAKGKEREDSDVDIVVVVTEAEFTRRRAERRLNGYIPELATYEGGYVDLKFVDVPFLEAAAERGSEPTRDSYKGARVVWSLIEGIEPMLAKIPVYPEADRSAKIRSFYGQMMTQRYFLGVAAQISEPFLATHAAARMVQFAARLILAENRVLFPCTRRLMERAGECSSQPEAFFPLAHALLQSRSPEAGEALIASMHAWRDFGITYLEALGQFSEDSEFNWLDCLAPVDDR